MKRGIKFLLLADAWVNLALGMLGPIYALFVEQIGGDILDASWAYFAYMLTTGVVIWLISRWEDRFAHKEILVTCGYLATSIGCLSYVFVNDQMSLLITQVILGFATALLNPAFDSLYSHYVTRKAETSDWGTWEAMGYVVTAVAAIVGGYIAYGFGFRTLFLVMFLSSIASTLVSFNMFRKKKYLRSNSSGHL